MALNRVSTCLWEEGILWYIAWYLCHSFGNRLRIKMLTMDPLLTQKVTNRHVKKHRRFLSDQIVTSRFLLHLDDDDDQDDKSSGRNFIPNFFSNTPVHVIFVLVTKERFPISVQGTVDLHYARVVCNFWSRGRVGKSRGQNRLLFNGSIAQNVLNSEKVGGANDRSRGRNRLRPHLRTTLIMPIDRYWHTL